MTRTDARSRTATVFDEEILVRLVDDSRRRQGLQPRISDRSAIEDLVAKLRPPGLAAGAAAEPPRRKARPAA